MDAGERARREAEIGRVLAEEWNPLGTADGVAPYGAYAHEVFSLLARGASDVQIARRLHEAERDELGHPELLARDLTPLMRSLRAIEKQL